MDFTATLCGVSVGAIVGMTGVGGGSLMTLMRLGRRAPRSLKPPLTVLCGLMLGVLVALS